MSTTREDRIRAHYRAMQRNCTDYPRSIGAWELRYYVARYWGIPCREVIAILKEKK